MFLGLIFGLELGLRSLRFVSFVVFPGCGGELMHGDDLVANARGDSAGLLPRMSRDVSVGGWFLQRSPDDLGVAARGGTPRGGRGGRRCGWLCRERREWRGRRRGRSFR